MIKETYCIDMVETFQGWRELRMDVYSPEGRAEGRPCLVYIFGGGWIEGGYTQETNTASYHGALLRFSMEKGFVYASIDYRLAWEAAFPAQLHDVKGALRFLRARSAGLGIDPGRIFCFGNSAGGHLTALLAMTEGLPGLEGTVGGNLDQPSGVAAAVTYYAPYDLRSLSSAAAGGPQLIEGAPSGIGAQKIEPQLQLVGSPFGAAALGAKLSAGDPEALAVVERLRQASPSSYVRPGLPPMLICHGGRDPVVPPEQSERMYRDLAACGNEVYYIAAAQGVHGPSLGAFVDGAARAFIAERAGA